MGIAPIGLPGELYLGGAGVAWGYWRRPAQTAEKFVPHPFGAPGERLYRTGDLARLLPDGQLELLGRTDHQIKVRGLRIEPTEIEAALKAHPSVLRCLVAARPDATGEKVLVAYIVARPGRSVVASALRRFIAERLPAFMVPSHIKTIDEIPLTPNGKVDRRHLPAPDDASHDRSRTYVAPRNDLERTIVERWSAVFGIEPIGIDDNFFDLGGDSLKAMKACQLPDRQVPIVGLYKHPTIRQLVEQVLVSGWVPGSVLHAIRPATPETTRTLVCFPYGGGSPIVFQPMADVLPRDWAIYALDPPGRDPARPGEALWSIEDTAAACVEGLSRTIRTPIVVYGHCGGVAMATEVARLLEAKGQPPLAVLLGAAIPQRDGDQAGLLDPLERLSDAEAHALLKQLGGFEEIDPAYLSSIMRAFRHDGRCAYRYFFEPERRHASSRVRTPLTCIVGSTDPLTPRYDESFGEWAGFYESVELRVIENAGHYFVKSHATQLAAIIGERTRAYSAAVQS
jgi:surfactin synthase thioesterase subunit